MISRTSNWLVAACEFDLQVYSRQETLTGRVGMDLDQSSLVGVDKVVFALKSALFGIWKTSFGLLEGETLSRSCKNGLTIKKFSE